jgi:hypothetical protein
MTKNRFLVKNPIQTSSLITLAIQKLNQMQAKNHRPRKLLHLRSALVLSALPQPALKPSLPQLLLQLQLSLRRLTPPPARQLVNPKTPPSKTPKNTRKRSLASLNDPTSPSPLNPPRLILSPCRKSSSIETRAINNENQTFVADSGMVWSSEPCFDRDKTVYSSTSIKSSVSNLEKIEQFFEFFINDEMLEIIVHFTNKRLNNDADFLSIQELKCYIGLLILFGFLKKNAVDVNDIWAFESAHHCHHATAAMPRERFKFISSVLTFDDFDTREERQISQIIILKSY